MKNLILINGTMGAGKTTVSRALQKILPDAVFLDGDWCWDADPFLVTEETKRMVMENITFLLAQFLDCSAYQNVIFCWVMHAKLPGFVRHACAERRRAAQKTHAGHCARKPRRSCYCTQSQPAWRLCRNEYRKARYQRAFTGRGCPPDCGNA